MTRIGKTNPTTSKPPSSNKSKDEVNNSFKEVRKDFFKKGGAATAIGLAGLALGSIRYGKQFPSKTLKFIGDGFGSVAGILAPFILAKNEINNHKLLKDGKKTKTGFIFNNLSDLFYRGCSIGFFPYNFKHFVDPGEIGSSKVSKAVTIANIPNLLLSGTLYGLGNVQAVLAWGLRLKEQVKVDQCSQELEKVKSQSPANKKQIGELEEKLKKLSDTEKSYDELFGSIKRVCTLGSIALPALYGLRRFGESIEAIFTDERSVSEFYEKPLIGASKAINLFIGVPEAYAKVFDGVARVVQEKEHIKPALPESLNSAIDGFAEKFESKVSSKENSTLKSSRYAAEVIFHTFSPLSHFAFLAPMFHRPTFNEEAQSRGGAIAIADKVIGVYSKALVSAFIGSYIFIARLPQAIAQMHFFGRRGIGKLLKEDEKDVSKKIDQTQNNFVNSKIIKSFSNGVKSTIKKLVPDFYDTKHPYGYLSFEEIQANESVKQAQQLFSDKFTNGIVSDEDKEEITNYCIDYINKSASKAYTELSTSEIEDITTLIDKKISTTSEEEPRRSEIAFPGAIFLANFLRPFDFSHRLNSKTLDSRSAFHRMETAYQNEEIVGFEQELYVVVSEATEGLKNMFHWTFGLETAA